MPHHLPLNPHTNHPFHLQKTLEGRQDFRWRKLPDAYHSVVLNNTLIHIRQIRRPPDLPFNPRRRPHRASSTSYFRLDDNLDAIYTRITARDDHIAKLIQKHPGVRLMRQPDPWECLVSYICSARAAPPRITHRVETIATQLGQPANPQRRDPPHLPRPRKPSSMPESDQLARNVPWLRPRPQSHHRSRPRASCDGRLDLHRLAQPGIPYDEAISQLTDLYGVGPKIANCVALFALDKTEAFPVDSRVRNNVRETLPVPHPLHRRRDHHVGPRPLRPPRRLRQPVPLHGLSRKRRRHHPLLA